MICVIHEVESKSWGFISYPDTPGAQKSICGTYSGFGHTVQLPYIFFWSSRWPTYIFWTKRVQLQRSVLNPNRPGAQKFIRNTEASFTHPYSRRNRVFFNETRVRCVDLKANRTRSFYVHLPAHSQHIRYRWFTFLNQRLPSLHIAELVQHSFSERYTWLSVERRRKEGRKDVAMGFIYPIDPTWLT
jgi:hypothetical protein